MLPEYGHNIQDFTRHPGNSYGVSTGSCLSPAAISLIVVQSPVNQLPLDKNIRCTRIGHFDVHTCLFAVPHFDAAFPFRFGDLLGVLSADDVNAPQMNDELAVAVGVALGRAAESDLANDQAFTVGHAPAAEISNDAVVHLRRRVEGKRLVRNPINIDACITEHVDSIGVAATCTRAELQNDPRRAKHQRRIHVVILMIQQGRQMLLRRLLDGWNRPALTLIQANPFDGAPIFVNLVNDADDCPEIGGGHIINVNQIRVSREDWRLETPGALLRRQRADLIPGFVAKIDNRASIAGVLPALKLRRLAHITKIARVIAIGIVAIRPPGIILEIERRAAASHIRAKRGNRRGGDLESRARLFRLSRRRLRQCGD